MTTLAAAPDAVARRTRPAPVAPLAPALSHAAARRVLWEATLLGVTADALLRESLTGLALPLWVALVALALLAACWSQGRRLERQAAGGLVAAVGFAATMAWRDAEPLQLAGFLATVGSLTMAAIAMHDRAAALFAARLRETVWAASLVVRRAIAGLLPVVFEEAIAPGDGAAMGRRAAPGLRAALLATAVVVVFGALLRGADPIFASLVELPDVDVGTAVSHVMFAGFFAWITAGWARAALDEREAPAVPEPRLPRLGAPELTATLGALNVLFILFVVAQLGWLFGGERFLRERTGLTAAEYARQGFFQMVWVVLLVVPLLLATRALLRDDRELQRRHGALALPLIGLLSVMVLSAAARMRLYVHYFGLTTERLYPMIFMAWLVVVLLWLAVTVLRGRGERFVAGAVLSALATLAIVDVAAPDAIVARVNIARAAAASDADHALDLVHLASLSGEAAPLAVDAVLHARSLRISPDRRCAAASRLIQRWGPESARAAHYRAEGGWREWNVGEASAMGVVAAHAAELRALRHASCTPGAASWRGEEAD